MNSYVNLYFKFISNRIFAKCIRLKAGEKVIVLISSIFIYKIRNKIYNINIINIKIKK